MDRETEEYSGDESAVIVECRRARIEDREISEGCARTIASWYDSAGAPELHAFVTTGALPDDVSAGIWWPCAMAAHYDSARADVRLALDFLGTYLINQPHPRGPVEGWAGQWVRPATLPPLPEQYDGTGYDWIGALSSGWVAVPAWGREGWDLGSWPLAIVAIYASDERGVYGTASYCEGDVLVNRHASRKAMYTAIDEIAAWHWRHNGDGPEDLPTEGEPLLPHQRGPYLPGRRD